VRETPLMHQYHADSHIYALGPHKDQNQYFDMYMDMMSITITVSS